MSMDQAPENNLPPPTDAAHHDPAAGTGLRLSGDAAREIAALRRQVAELTDHNTELLALVTRVQTTCAAGMHEAYTRYAETGNPDWLLQGRVLEAIWHLVKPVDFDTEV